MSNSHRAGPNFPRWMMEFLLPDELQEPVIGDLEEEYADSIASRVNWIDASLRYWRQALGSIVFVSFARITRRWFPGMSPNKGPKRWNRFAGKWKGRFSFPAFRDVRYAFRSFARQPVLTVTSLVTLALGIGATTAVFSLANALLFRPISGVKDGDRLAQITVGEWSSEPGSVSYSPRSLTLEDIEDVSSGFSAWEELAGYQEYEIHVAQDGAPAARLGSGAVMPNFFNVLRMTPTLGRFFVEDDDRPGAEPAVVISHRMWVNRFNRSRSAVGSTLQMNGITATVVGVAPPGFHGVLRYGDVDVWFTGAMDTMFRRWNARIVEQYGPRGRYWDFVGRLGAGKTFEEGQAEITTLIKGLTEVRVEVNQKFETVDGRVFPGLGLRGMARGILRKTVNLLAGVVLLVLFIACTNVANLLLARGSTREGETAIRKALGASAPRVLYEHLVEAVMLALTGGALGVAAAFLIVKIFEGTSFVGVYGFESVQMDWRVLGFTLALSTASGLVFGLVPAVAAMRSDFAGTLKESSRTKTPKKPFIRLGFASLQLGASVTLLLGAFWFLGTVRNLSEVDLGFNPHGVTTFAISPRDQGYEPERTEAYLSELLRTVKELPGVQSASVSSNYPFGYTRITRLYPVGTDPEITTVQARESETTAESFDVFQIPVVQGNNFPERELFATSEEAPAVISLALAERLFGAAYPIGRKIRTPVYMGGRYWVYEVVGVAADTRLNGFREEPGLLLYTPPTPEMAEMGMATLSVRTAGDAGAIIASVREVAGRLDSSLPLHRIRPLTEIVESRMSEERMFAKTLTMLAAFAAVLAGVGLYGLVTLGVTARTREFGIRIALGATALKISVLALRQGLIIVAAGGVLGALGSLWLANILQNRFFGVSASDPIWYVWAMLGLGAVAVFAAYRPAKAAASVDPAGALRHE